MGVSCPSLFASGASYILCDIASTLLFDVEAFLVQHGMSAIPQGAKGTGVNPNAVAPSTADDVRMIISLLLTPGLDPNIDRICVDLLKSSNHSAGIGMSS